MMPIEKVTKKILVVNIFNCLFHAASTVFFIPLFIELEFKVSDLAIFSVSASLTFMTLDIFTSYIFDNISKRFSISINFIAICLDSLFLSELTSLSYINVCILGILSALTIMFFFGAESSILLENIKKDKNLIYKITNLKQLIVFISDATFGIIFIMLVFYFNIIDMRTILKIIALLSFIFAFITFFILPKNKVKAKITKENFKYDFNIISKFIINNIMLITIVLLIYVTLSILHIFYSSILYPDIETMKENLLRLSFFPILLIITRNTSTIICNVVSYEKIKIPLLIISIFFLLALFLKYNYISIVIFVCLLSIVANLIHVQINFKIDDKLRATFFSLLGFISDILLILSTIAFTYLI